MKNDIIANQGNGMNLISATLGSYQADSTNRVAWIWQKPTFDLTKTSP